VQYIESMRATRELPARIVLTGHGEPVVDHVALIDERLRMHRRRARKFLRLLESGPLTAYEIAVQIWGNVAVTQAYLTLSEVLGHLDVLANEGQVRETEDGDVVRFHAVKDG
jgi:glyoxylase-like metal-dependent hydrolase (beta-lactamase superfamily II)